MFEDSYTLLPCQSFCKTFEAVVTGQTRYGIVPVGVRWVALFLRILIYCVNSILAIVGETRPRVVHNLIANRGVSFDAIPDLRASASRGTMR